MSTGGIQYLRDYLFAGLLRIVKKGILMRPVESLG
jgi:hypothetical protein